MSAPWRGLHGPAVFLALTLAACQPAPPQVARVVDGDTVVLTDGRRARLTDYDAPETHGRCERERVLARLATDALREFVRTDTFRLTDTGRRDHYDRALLTATVGGEPVAARMIAAGLAVVYPLGRRPDWCHGTP